jgi:Zn-finger nucleic acid-binding protein/uncharacterized protein YxjI
MQCPKCHHVSLKSATTNDKLFKLDTCPQCKGVWFDARELSQSLGRKAGEDHVPQHAFKAKDTACPHCKVKLFEYCYPQTTVLVDGCKQCHGVWLDDAEWKKIKETLYQRKDITCPKCQTQQVASTTCVQCGVIFERYKERQEELQAEAQAQQQRITDMFHHAGGYQIQQQFQWFEILSPFEQKNRYEVVVQADRNYLGYVYEHSKSFFNFFTRYFLGNCRPADLRFHDEYQNSILSMKKPFRFYFHQIEMFEPDGRMIGTIKRRFHWFKTKLDINDAQGNTIIKIDGPWIFLPFKDAIFRFLRNDDEIGSITKKWKGYMRENFTDSDTFHASFRRTLPMAEKILLFGAAFLIDFVYFENNVNEITD